MPETKVVKAVNLVIKTHVKAISDELKFQIEYERIFDGWEELYPKKTYTYKDLRKLYIGGIARALEMVRELPHFNDNELHNLAIKVSKSLK